MKTFILLTYIMYIIITYSLPDNIILLPRVNTYLKLRETNITLSNRRNNNDVYKLHRVETDDDKDNKTLFIKNYIINIKNDIYI